MTLQEKEKWTITRCSAESAEILSSDMVIHIGFRRLMPLADCKANTRLIATVLDSYEALKRAVNLLELAEKSPHKVKWGTKYGCLTPPETIVELKRAIAKVEGGN